MKRPLPIALTCSAVLLGAPAWGDYVEVEAIDAFYDQEVELDAAGKVRKANGANSDWDSLAIQELLTVIDADSAPATLELTQRTGGSWRGGTAWRIAPEQLALALPHNVEITVESLRDPEDAFGFYTESGDAESGAVIFSDLESVNLRSYVKIGSIKDELYFTVLDHEGDGEYEVESSSEFDPEDFLMYAVTGNRYLFVGLRSGGDRLDAAFQVEVGVDNGAALIAGAAKSGPVVAAVPLPPAAWGVIGILGLALRRRLRRV